VNKETYPPGPLPLGIWLREGGIKMRGVSPLSTSLRWVRGVVTYGLAADAPMAAGWEYMRKGGSEGKEEVFMEKNNEDEILRAYSILKALRENIDQIGSIPEKYVREYHTVLDKLESSSGINLSEFRIPDSEIQPSLRAFTPGKGAVYSSEKYAARAYMLTKMDALLGYFNTITSEKPRSVGFHKPND
jgi:hypothetical protein